MSDERREVCTHGENIAVLANEQANMNKRLDSMDITIKGIKIALEGKDGIISTGAKNSVSIGWLKLIVCSILFLILGFAAKDAFQHGIQMISKIGS